MNNEQKKEIEELIIQYSILKRRYCYRYDTRITSILSHTPKPSDISNKTETQALKNVEADEKIITMEKALECLNFKEKLVIERTYILNHNKEGFNVIAENAFMSYHTYRKHKKRAFKKIGLFLGILTKLKE